MAPALQAAAAKAESTAEDPCPELRGQGDYVNDYRLRNSSSWMKWKTEDNWKNHTRPAIERMKAGEYSQRVMADLDFTLVRWPNHTVALRALIDYARAGGKGYEFPAVGCYFQHARRYYPDDIEVLMLEGFYYSQRSNYERAKKSYLDALAINGESADAHYNLGLVYVELADYESALAHAHAAYRAGYPLPGLRNRLKQLGHWREPVAQGNSASVSPGTQRDPG